MRIIRSIIFSIGVMSVISVGFSQMLQLKKYPTLVGGVNVQHFKRCQKLILHLMKTTTCQTIPKISLPARDPSVECMRKAFLDTTCDQMKTFDKLFKPIISPYFIAKKYGNITVIQTMTEGDGLVDYWIINPEGYIIDIGIIGYKFLNITLSPTQVKHLKIGTNQPFVTNNLKPPIYKKLTTRYYSNKKQKALKFTTQVFISFIPIGSCASCDMIVEGVEKIIFDDSGKLLNIQVGTLHSIYGFLASSEGLNSLQQGGLP